MTVRGLEHFAIPPLLNNALQISTLEIHGLHSLTRPIQYAKVAEISSFIYIYIYNIHMEVESLDEILSFSLQSISQICAEMLRINIGSMDALLVIHLNGSCILFLSQVNST